MLLHFLLASLFSYFLYLFIYHFYFYFCLLFLWLLTWTPEIVANRVHSSLFYLLCLLAICLLIYFLSLSPSLGYFQCFPHFSMASPFCKCEVNGNSCLHSTVCNVSYSLALMCLDFPFSFLYFIFSFFLCLFFCIYPTWGIYFIFIFLFFIYLFFIVLPTDFSNNTIPLCQGLLYLVVYCRK